MTGILITKEELEKILKARFELRGYYADLMDYIDMNSFDEITKQQVEAARKAMDGFDALLEKIFSYK
jgi:hypothetical protein